jgi:hypothetical protein
MTAKRPFSRNDARFAAAQEYSKKNDLFCPIFLIPFFFCIDGPKQQKFCADMVDQGGGFNNWLCTFSFDYV